jgi:DNA-binding FadR family transcriptional regulator
MDLSPVNKVTTAQQAADKIVELVRSNNWPPGTQLPSERDMANQLKVGRSTVREALQILSTLSIIDIVSGVGSFTKDLDKNSLFRSETIGLLIRDASLLHLMEVREILEPHTLRLTCLRATDAELEKVEALLNLHEIKLLSGLDVASEAMQFHIMLAEASGNPVAARFIHSILELAQDRRWQDSPEDFKKRELAEHREILRLVRARDVNAASECLVRHIVQSAISDASSPRSKQSRNKNLRSI